MFDVSGLHIVDVEATGLLVCYAT